MKNVAEEFGCLVFTDAEMRQRLPEHIYKRLLAMRDTGAEWSDDVADCVAAAMLDWAMGKGATHYTHWFSPMTGKSAGKHMAFLAGEKEGQPVFKFSGNTLVRGESDASSFPSGGLRSTFEARGYTAWDPTSPAFIVGTTLYIPTAFCSHGGEALDQKTPLLRSMQALKTQGLRMLCLLGDNETKAVLPTVGAEQEYFIIDRDLYETRLDLRVCGRTLFGARPPKGQELDDHYYGRIRTRVLAFMEDLDATLWRMGVPSNTRHNEAAPSQHELAISYSLANVAADHDQLIMQTIRTVARRHNFHCILHEKPFDGVSGSGKHNNWSLMTNDGRNLLSPGHNPADNITFLMFLTAVIIAVDKYGDLVRLSAASASNDLRLGGNEAPPSVISVYLGDRFCDILSGKDSCGSDRAHLLTGVKSMPLLEIDSTDRNRTSPFAFTGNKFEFRMVGASQSIGFPNTVLNTAVAEALADLCSELEKLDAVTPEAAKQVIADAYAAHQRIVFNGNNYSEEWLREAERRGLPRFDSAVDSFPALLDEKNISLFSRMDVLSEAECRSRYGIMSDNYSNIVSIEAETMLEMAKKGILPACMDYLGELCGNMSNIAAAGLGCNAVRIKAGELSSLTDGINEAIDRLDDAYHAAITCKDTACKAALARELAWVHMPALRTLCDKAEQLLPSELWPFPSYADLLYSQ